MTLKEFDKIRIEIQRERYVGTCSDPITFGIRRAIFDQVRFKRLIAEAGKVSNPTKSLQLRMAQWQRQFDRAICTQHRLEQTRETAERNLTAQETNTPAMAMA